MSLMEATCLLNMVLWSCGFASLVATGTKLPKSLMFIYDCSIVATSPTSHLMSIACTLFDPFSDSYTVARPISNFGACVISVSEPLICALIRSMLRFISSAKSCSMQSKYANHLTCSMSMVSNLCSFRYVRLSLRNSCRLREWTITNDRIGRREACHRKK
jgi:hypothetical protein